MTSRQYSYCACYCMALGLLLFLGLGAQTVRAQVRGARALRSVDVRDSLDVDGGWDLIVRMDFTARYLRHVPDQSGRSVRIEVEPLDLGSIARLGGVFRENLPLPSTTAPLQEITFDQRKIDESFIEIQFTERVLFTVKQGDDLRELRIRVRREGSPLTVRPIDRLEEQGASSSAPNTVSGKLLQSARTAIRDGELDRAVSLLTKILENPGPDVSESDRRSARELLGLTRERRGQLAHARAEYETYLQEYPDGEAADRVQQRLDALVTASSQPSPGLRKRQQAPSRATTSIANIPLSYETFGTLGLRYFRNDTFLEDEQGGFLASDVLTDFDLANRIDSSAFAIDTDITATYDADVTGEETRSSDLRISRLQIRAEDKIHRIEATLGRQRRSDSGVLGRFDGLHVRGQLDSKFSVSGLVGMPVESTSDKKPNSDTLLVGGAIDMENWLIEGLRGQLFIVAERTDSLMQRTAIGGDLRYSTPKSYSFVYFDYDVLFEALNTVILSSSYYWSDATSFRAQVERRTTPILLLRTALQAQAIQDLERLRDFLSEDQIRRLAEDRTQVIYTGSAGVTHRINQKLQISGDLYITHSSSTEDVLDAQTGTQLPGIGSVGPDVSISSQLLVNDWWIENGIGSFSVRYFEGETSRAFSVSGFSRFPIIDQLRVNPRLRWEWRDSEVQAARSTLTPSLEFDWRFRSLLFNAEAGIEWVESISGGQQDRNTSYFVELGARWEF